MEGNEILWKLNSVSALVPIEIMNSVSSENPLFSCIVTLYTLILLYFPHALKISFSPVLILTALLLLFLLRLGAIQRLHSQNPKNNENEEKIETKENKESHFDEVEKSALLAQVDKWVACQAESGFDPNPKLNFEGSFVEWDVRAPLEVIYEDYEGEEEEGEDEDLNEKYPTRSVTLERYPSLSMYYPETDSDTSSEGDFPMTGGWDSPESVCFRWEEEDRAGLLIEIPLDSNDKKYSSLGFQVEEDNLIEIDISPTKNDAFSGEV